MPTDRREPPQDSSSDAARRGQNDDAKVVLWSRAGAEPPVDLVAALEGRGLEIVWASDSYGALARLCAAHGRAGEAPSGPVALVLSEPTRLGGPASADAGAVVAQARVRAPRAIVWVWDPLESVKLRPWRESDAMTPSESALEPDLEPEIVVKARPERASRTRQIGPPELRLAGEGPDSGGLGPNSGGEPVEVEEGIDAGPDLDHEPPARVSLTDEELAMLLADDPTGGPDSGDGDGAKSGREDHG